MVHPTTRAHSSNSTDNTIRMHPPTDTAERFMRPHRPTHMSSRHNIPTARIDTCDCTDRSMPESVGMPTPCRQHCLDCQLPPRTLPRTALMRGLCLQHCETTATDSARQRLTSCVFREPACFAAACLLRCGLRAAACEPACGLRVLASRPRISSLTIVNSGDPPAKKAPQKAAPRRGKRAVKAAR